MTQTKDVVVIQEALPHRPPFLFVDAVVERDLEKRSLVATKHITGDEPFFAGHFPQEPIMPGVLITEALAQAAGILLYELGIPNPLWLMNIHDAKYRQKVRPGALLTLKVQVFQSSAFAHKVRGVAYEATCRVSEAIMTLGRAK